MLSLQTPNQTLKVNQNALMVRPFFTKNHIHPFDAIEWELRKATITNEKGEVIFEENNLEFPKSWSQIATNIVSSKYFAGACDDPSQREKSVKSLVHRVSKTIADWGLQARYFENHQSSKTFEYELSHILVNQMASFNSPVWFNCGVPSHSNQFSACFINSVQDDMESILKLAKTEGMLFKWGSGTGTNLSTLRSSFEHLSGGGTASGPVSFMKGYDSFAGVIKSGGKTRRAAKMVILNIDHPDIHQFIVSKAQEEKKAWALIEAGYDGSFNGEAYNSIFFQNANHSVRVSDDFMHAVLNQKTWNTRFVLNQKKAQEYPSQKLLHDMAESCHICGDPGIQFHSTINHWHTCSNSGPINASNPCSEYMFLDDTACNLASINLLKFRNPDHSFNLQAFVHTVKIMILAQEIIVGFADYPTSKIAQNSHDFRPLGLGYANLGALLMSLGIPYDSPHGRNYAALITAIMTGEAYQTSATIAAVQKPFKYFSLNKKPMLKVIQQHQNALNQISQKDHPNIPDYQNISSYAKNVWQNALNLGQKWGYRNSQVTVLAPTGTIAFMMDCDTTGIEPDIALVKYKQLAGGGALKIINHSVPLALKTLNYSSQQIQQITQYIDQNDTIEGAPELLEKHLPVFDCAFKSINGTRSIGYMGHIKIMEAVQPFLSGAISKTVNMPAEASIPDIYNTFIEAWKRGLKSIAIYRDSSKKTQPLNTSIQNHDSENPSENLKSDQTLVHRKRLPNERKSLTHKFSVGGHEGYITVGMYQNGNPGEIFIVMSKEGSVVSGLMDSFATAISLALQYGVPLEVLVVKFIHTRFEPSGWTSNQEIPVAKSILDYIFKWLSFKFLQNSHHEKINHSLNHVLNQTNISKYEKQIFENQSDAIICSVCGSIMVRSGSCYRCLNCGDTSGCS